MTVAIPTAELEILAFSLAIFIVRFNPSISNESGYSFSFASETVAQQLNSLDMGANRRDLEVSSIILHHSIQVFGNFIRTLNNGMTINRSRKRDDCLHRWGPRFGEKDYGYIGIVQFGYTSIEREKQLMSATILGEINYVANEILKCNSYSPSSTFLQSDVVQYCDVIGSNKLYNTMMDCKIH